MKKILVAFVLISFFASSQEITINCTKLDSLIWKKVNDYRISIGVPPCNIFESGIMRDYSTRVTSANAKMKVGVHSDSVGYLCNSECIFDCTMAGGTDEMISRIDDVIEEEFDEIAAFVVQHWIDSPSHRHKISKPEYTISTVTTIIKVNKTASMSSLKLTCSYHSLSNLPGSTFSKATDAYVSKLTKKGKS